MISFILAIRVGDEVTNRGVYIYNEDVVPTDLAIKFKVRAL